jgi:hypothetical protein
MSGSNSVNASPRLVPKPPSDAKAPVAHLELGEFSLDAGDDDPTEVQRLAGGDVPPAGDSGRPNPCAAIGNALKRVAQPAVEFAGRHPFATSFVLTYAAGAVPAATGATVYYALEHEAIHRGRNDTDHMDTSPQGGSPGSAKAIANDAFMSLGISLVGGVASTVASCVPSCVRAVKERLNT